MQPVVTSTVASAFRKAHPRRGAKGALGSVDPAVASAVLSGYTSEMFQKQDTIFGEAMSNASATADASSGVSVGARSAAGSGRRGSRITRRFAVSVNAFTASGLDSGEVDALRTHPSVRSVTPDRAVQAHTITTPEYLDIPKVWTEQYGGIAKAASDVLIGMVDTGITVGAASFSGDTPRSPNPWASMGLGSGSCGEAGTCNAGKLIGCQFFESGFAELMKDPTLAGYTRPPGDVSTCKDNDGHGSHTASTAAGNHGSPAVIDGEPAAKDGMSGMAPGAALSVYKVLWNYVDPDGNVANSGTLSDVVAAIDQALKDGVDVINFSVGAGAPTFSFEDPTYAAFMGAALGGALVAVAGGNSGDPESVENSMPWAVTVAAGSHPREEVANVTLAGTPGAGTWPGSMASREPFPATPVYFAGAASENASLCLNDTLDAAQVAGKVVMCLRGISYRVHKSAEVKRAGGVGMILMNVVDGDTGTYKDAHSVPSIHVESDAGEGITAAYLQAPATTTASMTGDVYTNTAEAPAVAWFSSRGPTITDSSALLKPDVMAPGLDIIAVYKAEDGSNDTAASLSGTSMATPHIAGIAALIMGKHPDWSPASVKSAIMTTATQTTNKGNPLDGTPFDYGAGFVDPVKALDPGLVYDAGEVDYHRYVCTTMKDKSIRRKKAVKPTPPAYCKTDCASPACVFPQTLMDTNMPSFSLTPVKRGKTAKATRRMKFVGQGSAKFTATVQLPTGFVASVTPPLKRLARAKAGAVPVELSFSSYMEEQSYTLSVTVPRTASKGWAFGSITWQDAAGLYSVRSPIAINVT